MEEISPQACPTTATIRRNPHRRARPTPAKTPSSHSLPSKNLNIPNFPLDDILSMDVHLQQNPKIPSPDPSVSLNVFLRVRPLPIAPSKPSKSKLPNSKKPTKSCLTINDSHSILISPPICDSNRLKSEVYNGFSHVFSSDSSQDEVYDKLMKPMVEGFLNGKSGLLAALGPSGSGKTHTVFGSVKEPGLVPRALRHIFDTEAGKSPMMLRSFYISIFEIYSEKGKGEKLSDLSPDGTDIYMQQSAVKGLKEILIKDVAQAEFLLTQAKSKRVTAVTNSNSQSSRSQCIINIRCAVDETVGKSESLPNEAVLTFVDLAGAEREKKTGNKGGRLLESNFINNTSMVFGLCLRSLLEHQKNPKKPMQKHFQSSLLTRYLRDYLEGRKRMALILTIRSGEEDYFDTSFLLRQASPYMEIKFCDVEEISNLPRNKRRNQIVGNEQKKRAKLTRVESADVKNDAKMTHRDSKDFPKEEVKTVDTAGGNKRSPVSRINDNSLSKADCTDSNIYRQYYVMQGFAKALWSVLKQYKERVKTLEKDIDILKDNLSIGDAKYLEIEKELLNLKSQRSHHNQGLGVASCSIGGPSSKSKISEEEKSDHVKVVSADIKGLADLECKEFKTIRTSGENSTSLHDCELGGVAVPAIPEEKHEYSTSACISKNLHREENIHFESEVGASLSPETGWQCAGFEGKMAGNYNQDKESRSGSLKELLELQGSGSINISKVYSGDLPLGPKSYLSVDESVDPDIIMTRHFHKANLSSPNLNKFSPPSYQAQSFLIEREMSHDMSDCQKDPKKEFDEKSSDAAACLPRSHNLDSINQGESCGFDTKHEKDKENVVDFLGSNFNSELETKEISHSKPSKVERPRRRLMPASSLLLRDAGNVDVTDEIVKSKGGRGRRKLVEDDHIRTTGSASLMRLLKKNLPR